MSMMSNNSSVKRFGWPHLLGLIVLIAFAVAIALLRQRTVEPPMHSRDTTQRNGSVSIVTPDTTAADIELLSPTLLVESDTMGYELGAVDDPNISPDRRPADKAGYEDGFLAGSEDALTRQYKASYDETNSFIGEANVLYNANYRKGYEAGYTSSLD